MTTPPPIKISDEAMKTAVAAAVAEYLEWRRMPNREAYVSVLATNAARCAAEAVAPLIAAQVLQPAAIAALYDFWRYFHYYAGGYDASSLGLITAYDRDDAFEMDRLSDLVGPHEAAIRAALGRPGEHDNGQEVIAKLGDDLGVSGGTQK